MGRETRRSRNSPVREGGGGVPCNILGLSAFFHESACCLIQDGRLIAAASEERFSRLKHDPGLPVSAFRYCLAAGGIDAGELDCLAYYEEATAKLARQLWAEASPGAPPGLPWLDPLRPERAIRQGLGYEGPIRSYRHHRSHAASAFLYSGFEEAAILTVDGVGEWATTTYGRGCGTGVELFEEVSFPHSLGLLYSTLTSYLGFAVNDGEYKVMGLAPYGRPRFAEQVRALLARGEAQGEARQEKEAADGQYRLDLRYFDFLGGGRMYSDELPALLGAPPRRHGERIDGFHCDVASSLQRVLEEVLLEKVHYLHRRTGARDLAMAGGVALNCVANGRILREGPFRRLFVQPAAGDAGACLGAAALACADLLGCRPLVAAGDPGRTAGAPPSAAGAAEEKGRAAGRPNGTGLRRVDLGPAWSAEEVAGLLAAAGLPAHDFRGRESELLEAVVDRLVDRKVVGWFQGRLEFGPRALGGRSLLADPRDPGARERLNLLVKKREEFRPFAPSVLAAHAAEHFELDHPSPFMLETCQVRSPLGLPAITHVDGSARPQTVDPGDLPRFAALLAAFHRRTGCPVLVNTSFNVRGEPIVASPVDALFTMAAAGIDTLAIEDFLIDKSSLPEGWPELLAQWREPAPSVFAKDGQLRAAIGEDLYSFV